MICDGPNALVRNKENIIRKTCMRNDVDFTFIKGK
jgi:hypothetical protein